MGTPRQPDSPRPGRRHMQQFQQLPRLCGGDRCTEPALQLHLAAPCEKGESKRRKIMEKGCQKTRKRWKLMETYGVNRNKHIGVQYVKDRESCVYIQQNLLQGTAQYASSVQCHAIFWLIFSHIKPNMQDCNNGVCCACVTPGIFTADQRCFPAMETYG